HRRSIDDQPAAAPVFPGRVRAVPGARQPAGYQFERAVVNPDQVEPGSTVTSSIGANCATDNTIEVHAMDAHPGATSDDQRGCSPAHAQDAELMALPPQCQVPRYFERFVQQEVVGGQ